MHLTNIVNHIAKMNPTPKCAMCIMWCGYVSDPFAFVTLKSYHTTSSTRLITRVSERNMQKNDPSSVTRAKGSVTYPGKNTYILFEKSNKETIIFSAINA